MASVDEVMGTHWDGCWRDHPECADALAAALSAMQEENARLRELVREQYEFGATAFGTLRGRPYGCTVMSTRPADECTCWGCRARRALSTQDSPEGQEGK